VKRAGLSTELDPKGATPCFCESCMRLGGRARELLRARWFASALRLVRRVGDEPPPLIERKERTRERQRAYDITRRSRSARGLR